MAQGLAAQIARAGQRIDRGWADGWSRTKWSALRVAGLCRCARRSAHGGAPCAVRCAHGGARCSPAEGADAAFHSCWGVMASILLNTDVTVRHCTVTAQHRSPSRPARLERQGAGPPRRPNIPVARPTRAGIPITCPSTRSACPSPGLGDRPSAQPVDGFHGSRLAGASGRALWTPTTAADVPTAMGGDL